MKDFMGKDGFSWFVGVVEDRNDPAKVGRVRVRVLGHHSENLTEVKTTDLPWAHVMHPVTDPSMQGLGHTPSFLTQGSWVVGFFRDNEKQQPVIMGSLPGIPEDPSAPTTGFNDPRGITATQNAYKGNPKYGPYPGEIEHSDHEIGEPDTNRLARGGESEDHSALINRRTERLAGDPSGETPEDVTRALLMVFLPQRNRFWRTYQTKRSKKNADIGKNRILKVLSKMQTPISLASILITMYLSLSLAISLR